MASPGRNVFRIMNEPCRGLAQWMEGTKRATWCDMSLFVNIAYYCFRAFNLSFPPKLVDQSLVYSGQGGDT